MELLVKYGASIQAITEVRLGVGMSRDNVLLTLQTFDDTVSLALVWADAHPRSCVHGPPQHRFTAPPERSISGHP